MLFADLRYGFRQLRLNPGFAAIAIVTLALGIGANTALFSVVRNVLLKPLPYRDPERLMRVWMDNRRLQMREDWASYLNYQDYKRLGTSFESMAAFTEPSLNLISDGEPERIRGAFAEAATFRRARRHAASQGRLFTKDEEAGGQGNVVVIGWGLWQRRFGGALRTSSARCSTSTAAGDGHRRHAAGLRISREEERILGAARRRRAGQTPRRLLAADGRAPEAGRHAGPGPDPDGRRSANSSSSSTRPRTPATGST